MNPRCDYCDSNHNPQVLRMAPPHGSMLFTICHRCLELKLIGTGMKLAPREQEIVIWADDVMREQSGDDPDDHASYGLQVEGG